MATQGHPRFFVRIKKKFEVLTLPVHPSSEIPVILIPPDGYNGIDLTRYPVMHVSYAAKRVSSRVQDLQRRYPRGIVIYEVDGDKGVVRGIVLPASFNAPNRFQYFNENL